MAITLGPFDQLRGTRAYEAMAAKAALRRWVDGQLVCRRNDPAEYVCIIQEGLAEVVAQHRDRRVRLAMLRKGDLFGEVAFVKAGRRTATLIAVGDLTGRTIGFDELAALRRVHPEVTEVILDVLYERVQRLSRQLATATWSAAAESRVLQHLLNLDLGVLGDEIPLSAESIGEGVGVSRQTVQRILKRHEDLGHLAPRHAGRKGVRVLDHDGIYAALDADDGGER